MPTNLPKKTRNCRGRKGHCFDSCPANGDALKTIHKEKAFASEVGGMKQLIALAQALSEQEIRAVFSNPILPQRRSIDRLSDTLLGLPVLKRLPLPPPLQTAESVRRHSG